MVYVIAVIEMGNVEVTQKTMNAAVAAGAHAIAIERSAGLHIPDDDLRQLKAHADLLGIDFGCTVYDVESVDFLVSLHLTFIRVPAEEFTNLQLTQIIASKQKYFILITGRTTLNIIKRMVQIVNAINPNYNLLYSSSSYPTNVKDIHLRSLDTLRKNIPVKQIGYSGYEIGYIPTLGAVARGVQLIERAFAMHSDLSDGVLDAKTFQNMVEELHCMEQALGSFQKGVGLLTQYE